MLNSREAAALPEATYSRAPHEYVKLIDHYIESHVKADNEKIAYILRRFAEPTPKCRPVDAALSRRERA